MILFSLLPLYPLDGYRLYYKLLTTIYDDEYSYSLLKYSGFLVITGLIITCMVSKSIAITIITVFLIIKQVENKNRFKTKEHTKKYLLTKYFEKI